MVVSCVSSKLQGMIKSMVSLLNIFRFARLGATVVTWDINKAGNEETVAMIKKEGNKAFEYTVNMTNR